MAGRILGMGDVVSLVEKAQEHFDEKMAEDMGVSFLGRIPIYQPIREGSDRGNPLVLSEPDSPAARAFMAAAERVAAEVSIASYRTAPTTVR